VSEYLVEVYVPRAAAAFAMPPLQDVSGAAEQLTRAGRHVQLLSSIYLPEDETCLYIYQGQSGDAVREAAARSGLLVERVLEAVCEQGAIR
jgi:hypothetical protein